MAPILDTSIIVRYLTGDPPRLATRAARIIDSGEVLAIPDVVIAETAFVLASVYGVARSQVVETLVALVQKRNLVTLPAAKGEIIQALLMCRPSRRVSFADAMVWATARSARAEAVYSFDQRFPEEGIELRRDLA